MATTYFGSCNSDGSYLTGWTFSDKWANVAVWNIMDVHNFKCPGFGPMKAVELTTACHYHTAGVNIRLAIYSADRSTLIYQGDSEVAVVGDTTDTWQGHFGDNLCILQGGTGYLLVLSMDADLRTDHSNTSVRMSYRNAVDYTAGFPTPLPAPTSNQSYPWSIRCGVIPYDSVFVADSSNWQDVNDMDIAIDGNMQNIIEGWIAVDGVWQRFWPPPI